MGRISCEFVGTMSQGLSFDPVEFRGMAVSQITDEIMRMLSSIHPGVNFFLDDIVVAADQVAEAARER